MSNALTRIATDWAIRCFGKEHVLNRAIRGLRTLEEAAELAQALGVPEDKAAKCIQTVYSRPVGDPEQEIGGVLQTLAVLCESMGVDRDELFERELRRCLAKNPEHFRKRNQEKLDLGLDTPIPPPSDRDHNYDHRTADPASFFSTCTREDHLCATIGQGPCNGLPRPFHLAGNNEIIHCDRMWRDQKTRAVFNKAYTEHGFILSIDLDPKIDGFYQEAFQRWAAASYRFEKPDMSRITRNADGSAS